MAIYALGDIQGCLDELVRLLDRLGFDPERDRLWFVGDLVNRGPRSLETLRFVKGLGQGAVTVLGNHDLSLLSRHLGVRKLKPGSSLKPILKAPDRDELMDWLRHRPLLHHDPELGFTMVHAGLLPQWDLEVALRLAQEVEAVLRGSGYVKFFKNMYGDRPRRWSNKLHGWDRLRLLTNVFTRLRYCDHKGRINLDYSGPPGSQPDGLLPWFEIPDRRSASLKVVFGHWSTLGYTTSPGVWSIDTGCVWGGSLTALRLDSSPPHAYSLDCPGAAQPGG